MEDDLVHNTVRKIREGLLMSKAELAKSARTSPLTVDRIEKGAIMNEGTRNQLEYEKFDSLFLIRYGEN